jgi:hypothetical protein
MQLLPPSVIVPPTSQDGRIGLSDVIYTIPARAKLNSSWRARPTMMWSGTRTPTYFRAWAILLVASMSSLEGSVSYLK